MANKPGTGSEASSSLAGVADLVRDSVRAHARAVETTQNWSEGALGALKDQAETVGGMLRSVDASLQAIEQVVKSQAEATAALAENLRASREVVDNAMAAHRHTLEGMETYVSGMMDVLTGQVEAMRSLVDMSKVSGPLAAQSTAFQQLAADWTQAYEQLSRSVPHPFGPTGGS